MEPNSTALFTSCARNTGASVALLTVYDMCKAVDRSMEILSVHLVEKHGGKSGDFYYGDEK